MDAILLPVPDAYKALGIGRTKFYQIVAAGEISIIKIGKRTLIPRESLTAYAAKLLSESKAA